MLRTAIVSKLAPITSHPTAEEREQMHALYRRAGDELRRRMSFIRIPIALTAVALISKRSTSGWRITARRFTTRSSAPGGTTRALPAAARLVASGFTSRSAASKRSATPKPQRCRSYRTIGARRRRFCNFLRDGVRRDAMHNRDCLAIQPSPVETDAPNAQQRPESFILIGDEIDDLHLPKSPRQFVEIAFSIKQGNDPVVVS
jgi:hypothetical protein